VIGKKECDQIEPADVRRNRVVEIPDDMHDVFMTGFCARMSNLSLTKRSMTAAESCA